MAFYKELKALLPQLGNPKFLHVLLEPLLLWGILFGVIAWVISLWVIRNRQAQICSLIMIALSAFAIFPVLHYRKKASPISTGSVALRDAQNERRRETQWIYYVLGSLAGLGIFLTGPDKGKAGTGIALGIALGGTATVLFTLWLHEKEIILFHPDAQRPAPASRR
jgi:hypothetical protein